MKNPLAYLAVGLVILIVGFLSFQASKKSEPMQQDENNPIVTAYQKLSPQAQALYYKQSAKLTKPVPDRLVELDEKTIGCFGPKQVLAMSTSEDNLGGQCCGTLTSFEAYELQIKAIERFVQEHGGADLIPPDPYDVPVDVAQKLTQFDIDIVLSQEQQVIFDEAVAMSHHGGPCCCKCWKWYVMSGLAKKLIVDEGWDVHQIAETWDISSSCGHSEDTNIFKHYEKDGMKHT
ncbi:hypothetical protein COU78_02165 [Candidatus Peregrinibacteria bacterium CG10_big_fil_rev_8_21_14_0_10_49_24]|nr:MAG: hypothetical protein COV83_03765 [Candidatus Peregrinibacteria bacterium CG11_big_fil_rev_8_21_14_0_20_49_14]PIR51282.1 MAG: hypothetical protein COU78_02165 [Candidatus Peregrinibacteria bacterium CG10_big_fil_rev_8_21_14_0_10_49_24]PJA68090.1 MAG: hypothetical protein CO157_00930 [Candidatus Peregrinibacteria bacterium CG_4_9_14_3_um_filter_49_12]